MSSQFTSESLIKRVSRSSTQGSTVTLTIDDDVCNAMFGHEGKRGMFVWQEIGNDEQQSVTEAFERPSAKDVEAERYARWQKLGPRTKWLIDRCKELEFQKFLGIQNDVFVNKERELKAKEIVIETLGLKTSRSEVDDFKIHAPFDELRELYAKWIRHNARSS
jgi:hypothetical protein